MCEVVTILAKLCKYKLVLLRCEYKFQLLHVLCLGCGLFGWVGNLRQSHVPLVHVDVVLICHVLQFYIIPS